MSKDNKARKIDQFFRSSSYVVKVGTEITTNKISQVENEQRNNIYFVIYKVRTNILLIFYHYEVLIIQCK